MNRVIEYIRFAVWFVGLGYIVMWPLTAHDNALVQLEASLVCGRTFGLKDLMCDPHAVLHLSPGLHLIGLLAAIGVVLRLLLRRFLRAPLPATGESPSPALAVRMAATLERSFGRPSGHAFGPAFGQKPLPPLRTVKPRAHFGLRDAPPLRKPHRNVPP